MCLSEFVINYTSAPADEQASDSKNRKRKGGGLPSSVKLKGNTGVMRLKGRQSGLRLNESIKRLKVTHSYTQSACFTGHGKSKSSCTGIRPRPVRI